MPASELDTSSPQSADPGTKLLEQYRMASDPESRPEPAETPTETVVAPEPPAAPKLPSYLTKLAKQHGFNESDLSSMSADDVRDAIVLAKGRSEEHRDVERGIRLNAAGRPYDPQTGRLLPVVADPKPEPEVPFSLKELGIDETNLDPDFAKTLTALAKPIIERNKALEDKLKRLEDGLGEVDRRDQARTHAAALDQLDRMFVQNKAVFGEGSREDLDPDSPEYQRRAMVVDRMEKNFAADKTLSFRKNFEKASKAFAGVSTPTSPPPPPAAIEDPKGFRNGATIVPTNRRFAELPLGTKRAEAAVDDFMRNMEEEEVTQKPVLPK